MMASVRVHRYVCSFILPVYYLFETVNNNISWLLKHATVKTLTYNRHYEFMMLAISNISPYVI